MLKIQGGHTLEGSVSISGSKNAAAPIISAALLFDTAVLHNVPRIGDVFNLLEIIKTFGISVDFTGNDLTLKWIEASDANIDRDRMKKIRISILLLPTLLQKFGRATFPFPGGCNIGKRPIGEHISGLVDLGYNLSTDNEMYSLSGSKKSGEIHLHANRMVTATENLLTASVMRSGTTIIHNAAYEPHVIDLVNALRSAGVQIETRYNHQIIVQGVEKLPTKLEYTITSDYLESGTFVILGALASKTHIDIEHAAISDLDAFLERVHAIGVRTEDLGNDTLRVFRSRNLTAIDLQTNIFPGVPSDLQSPLAILLTQAEGISRIHEVLYEGRFTYLLELEKMKGHVALLNPHEAMVFGPTPLRGATVSSWDLRAGAAMIIAGLIAEGETSITNVEYIERGYEDIVGKLVKIGAKIVKQDVL
ncbi:MAG: UDP-N-acetylglucosamine 1-carboxyvinyltransferase [Candidatus Gracilibacteria bacterium]|nr:UDP-N-acetylglucosamine 1-carboxyvinyltransferase [Candidatus Gracilibacteria bacterium]